LSSRSRSIDEFLARLDADEAQARASDAEKRQRRAEAMCRQIRQALIDLGFDHLAEWAEHVDGAVSFGDLEPRRAERFVEMLEVVAERARRFG